MAGVSETVHIRGKPSFWRQEEAAGVVSLAQIGVYFLPVRRHLRCSWITLTKVMVSMLSPLTLKGQVGTRLGMAFAGCEIGILICSQFPGAVSHTTAGDSRGRTAGLAQRWL